MGTVHVAHCDCGFEIDVTVGGSRHGFLERSLFPFFCEDCGLVEVNVAKLEHRQYRVCCPQCNTKQAQQYGTKPVSEHDTRLTGKWWSRFFGSDQSKQPAKIQWNPREATETGHVCPMCREMTLTFSGATLYFD